MASNRRWAIGRFTRSVPLRAFLWCCLQLVLACRAIAQDSSCERPLILVGKPYPQYQEVAAAFSERWKESTGQEPTVISFPAQESAKKQLLTTSRPTLVVGLGEVPTVWALGREESFRLAFTMVVAPERLQGFAKMLSTKPRSLSGGSIEVAPEKQLDMLLAMMPGISRIGVVTSSTAFRDNVAKLQRLCAARNVELIHLEVPALADIPVKLKGLLTQVQLMWSLPDPRVYQSELAQYIIAQCADRQVPLVGLSANFVKSGATISFDPDYHEIGQLLAKQCLVPVEGELGRLTI